MPAGFGRTASPRHPPFRLAGRYDTAFGVTLFSRIRESCAEVERTARFVRIDFEALAVLAEHLSHEGAGPDVLDPAHSGLSDEDSTLAFVLCLDAINFGSGWFPELAKRPGLSGYFTLASALREHFESGGRMDADVLCRITGEECAEILEQDFRSPPVVELMELFARAWRDLGALIAERFGGSFRSLVEAADHSAANLVEILSAMAFYQDEAQHLGHKVFFYKRAQLTCADLAEAFEGRGPGRFDDLEQLTLFADNLVPHVLRMEGVLTYDDGLLQRIREGHLIPAGSIEEVEIRAVAVHAVECLTPKVMSGDARPCPYQIDHLLWHRGQSPAMKAHPRHRTRCTFY